MQAGFFLSNPRAPRRKEKGQQMIRGLSSGEPGADTSFDPEYKGELPTRCYGNLFEATETQGALPTWVRLEDKFDTNDLQGMPIIDGALLGKAINLFANNKSCA